MLLHDATDRETAPLTRPRTLTAWRCLLVIALLPCVAAAEEPKGLQLVLSDSTQRQFAAFAGLHKYALVVGVNRYDNEKQGITPLRFAVSDAASVYEALTDPRRGGFPTENVTLLTDDTPEKPTGPAIGKALNRLITQAKEDDLVLVFFSGHGYEDNGRAYLLTTNTDLDALDYTAIERDAFVRQIDRLAAKKVVVVLDACHSGGVNRGGKGAGKDIALSSKYYESFVGAKGRAFIASSGGGELSWEDEDRGHGVFTGALVSALSGEADGQPKDGIVSLNELRTYVEREVSGWAGKRGRTQNPQVNLESASGDIPLALNYAYMVSQAQDLQQRREVVGDLRARLAGIEGLLPSETARALDLLGRYAQGLPLSTPEQQHLDLVQKLATHSIEVKTYRSAVAGTPGLMTPEQAGLTRRRPSKTLWILGGVAATAAGVALGLGGGGDGAPGPAPDLPAPPPPPPAP